MKNRVTVPEIIASKGKRKLSELTAYDYPTALWADQSGIDMLLVGDSLAMVVLGHDDTLSVGMTEMLHHTSAVARGAKRALVIGDMPFMSYQVSVEEALYNAGLFLKEAKAQAVKLEGGRRVAPQVKAMVEAGIPVQGHLGLTPQSSAQFGGFKIQGKTAEAAKILIEDAQILAEAGCFSIVLEGIPSNVAAMVTEAIPVPTIGIGAGPDCDGQVLVIHDVLGLYDRFVPKFVKKYAQLGLTIKEALTKYREEVENGTFPGPEHEFGMAELEAKKLSGLEDKK
ncbi:3-methyl-2-oxobutanoate hydroxymethyltransferase [Syntrophobacter fumaroxidans]|uniref:3-methyl-2-oxobutanoate hydroxymethyltransferase n=1 Tax=Syntrophobacter fumaroxidans (strain DSM 10017 / MPOB) TaxID=335543 RepID=PANB_SYNFM|nr:3-methyl-2-oxobutanoate hydroxymethyltransferase [Syntrophobacter fumaroxidans]A0LLW3.1 RecName: Full=3-methyl-2-oxobutanoate hydroxymethyltransferase; AltName: Full=Ketopantoate hydroxymethyltransferase; Short=KPHMT [Syntrophobacter fumaroxidans MPOB]ABK18415.1 3-methyl-2-oxobutanoate hydroxymethyltransferase [Syntrophobacter fumaroxidans MPOB]HOI94916.1 3-methyl-2-oxobutanoate hydroxymethyltransferase [Syntrophobacter fumaroxidans]